ncbi:MAG: FtsW/RodA/SpoVE family cell cycle protein [Rhodovarius sp.]|nr:FtsW/RodA/SpoVE family cell cycle protein [Rhodovarius sp.]MCX7930960.1 FtsW/RodA/SpoVE family cell cycle protein [Rhodovarius sp.]MDW8314756.1 FtsW/RodA/SpoVE family cell cycle protein [Rhodovarius sp.]
MEVSRTDTSLLGRWWWGVDRWTLAALFALLIAGSIMALATGGARMRDLSAGAQVLRQLLFPAMAAATLVVASLLPVRWVVRLAFAGLVLFLALTAATLVVGTEIKGGRRWLHIAGQSLQPSEFLKPLLAVCCAWLLALGPRIGRLAAFLLALLPVAAAGLLLKLQPDVGMLAVVVAVFLAQVFMAGLPLWLVGVFAAGAAGVGVLAYLALGHVRLRIDRWWHAIRHPEPPGVAPTQEERSLQAFGHGGLWGQGPGEGRVKHHLPDADADFVFAVVGEEFGLVVCLGLIGIFAFIVLRGLLRLAEERDLFVALAASGLLTQFGLQAFINMGSTLRLIPTKGMTLPFISHGGSSMLAIAAGMGMLLALTRRRGLRRDGLA